MRLCALSLLFVALSVPAQACLQSLLLAGGNPYVEANAWPVLPDEASARSTLVIVGTRMDAEGTELFPTAFQGPSVLNSHQRNFPKLPSRTLDFSRIPNEEILIQAINEYARGYAIIQFATHSNEGVVEINSNEKVYLRPEHFARLQLDGKIIIFAGCMAGMTKTPAEKRLMDRLMADTKAKAALGLKRITSSSRVQVFTSGDNPELLMDETQLDDFLTPIWHVHLQGGKYQNSTPYFPFDTLDMDGALERQLTAAGIPVPANPFPPIEEPDPLADWRILVRP